VKTFNYVPEGGRLLPRWIALVRDTQLRFALGTIGATLLLITIAWSVETLRLARLDGELAALAVAQAAARAVEHDAARLQADLQHLRALEAGLATARREAIDTTNVVAVVGNRLPERTWLTSVQATADGTWSIAGRTTHVAAVGSTLRTIGELDGTAAAHLQSISASGRTRRIVDFAIAWERRR
jgi:Tfp pilus assembly protein PilN